MTGITGQVSVILRSIASRRCVSKDGPLESFGYGAGTVIGLPLSTICTVNSFSVLSPITL